MNKPTKQSAIKRASLNEYQLRDLALAETLQSELIAAGFMASRVVHETDNNNFFVIFYDGTNEYQITRTTYRPEVSVMRLPYERNENVSSHTRSEIYKKTHTANRVKVITQKKIQALIDEENEYRRLMSEAEAQAGDKVQKFLAQVQALNIPVQYSHELNYSNAADHKPTKVKITGGRIERGGLEFSFEISQDGYVSKKIRVSYAQDDTLENFMRLSDNKTNAWKNITYL